MESALPLPNVQRRFNAAANRSAFSGAGSEWSAKAFLLVATVARPPLHTSNKRHTTLNWQDLAPKVPRRRKGRSPEAPGETVPSLFIPTFPGRDSKGRQTRKGHYPSWDRADLKPQTYFRSKVTEPATSKPRPALGVALLEGIQTKQTKHSESGVFFLKFLADIIAAWNVTL